MKKLLTIGLAAAALAGGVAASSGPALAADWNHGGYNQGYDRDHNDHDRGEWRGDRHDRRYRHEYRRGYGYREVCRTVWRWSPYYGRNVRSVRCY